MVEVSFLGPIQKEPLRLEISSLKELRAILQLDEGLKDWLKLCALSLNDELITSLDIPLKDGDKIALLPPVCGG